jgi:deoxyribodipyrimidine photo-lyase
VRRWLPELAPVPQAFVHEPWKMPLDVQSECGVKIGTDYPAPIVDHAVVKERVLNAYKKA